VAGRGAGWGRTEAAISSAHIRAVTTTADNAGYRCTTHDVSTGRVQPSSPGSLSNRETAGMSDTKQTYNDDVFSWMPLVCDDIDGTRQTTAFSQTINNLLAKTAFWHVCTQYGVLVKQTALSGPT